MAKEKLDIKTKVYFTNCLTLLAVFIVATIIFGFGASGEPFHSFSLQDGYIVTSLLAVGYAVHRIAMDLARNEKDEDKN